MRQNINDQTQYGYTDWVSLSKKENYLDVYCILNFIKWKYINGINFW